ncbi:hypothetical protein SAMN04488005_3131 [Yoonia tamlensis]|uniref:Outer membrane protein beta-barrel domain-containing protein n=1 Tax=Yoonia tamlensis TaxID=390270 RepID=A0A1I6HYR6_9RHOB|nr:hypothetical protein [Yoonia tamlensis]SFR59591.1 hypothetical protein SAMN04488005_3131 [Yoonia tamlensis]
MNFYATVLAAMIAATAAQAQDFYAGAEILQFQLSDTDGDDTQEEFRPAARLTFGYALSDAQAIELKGFLFETEDEEASAVKIRYADLAYVSTVALGDNLDARFHAGVRYFELTAPGSIWNGSVGPVIGARLSSDLGNGFALYGAAETALVFGDETTEAHPHQVAMRQLATGVSYAQAMGGGTLEATFGLEAHQYQSVRDAEEDYGLIGFGLGARYSF